MRFIGVIRYSLGGLIARCVVKRIVDSPFFEKIELCNFTTFASPSIGVPGYVEKKASL